MKRKIIKIEDHLCNGCGNCITGCSEGALKLVEGKVKLVKEDFCDGFGDCIGTCPTGALTIEEREAAPFDEKATKNYLLKTEGEKAVIKMEEAQKKHNHPTKSGCPGNKIISENKNVQWPLQLHLVNPIMPIFKNKELVIVSTCSPAASSLVRPQYISGRSCVIACPKLDRTDPYVEKLTEIFKEKSIPKIIILRMEVPCCGGLSVMAKEARNHSGRNDLIIEEHVLSVEGSLKTVNEL